MKSNLEYEMEIGELRSTLAFVSGYCAGAVEINSSIKPSEAKEIREKIQKVLDKSPATC